MHGLSPPGLPNNMPLSNSNYTLDHDYNPQSGGTLESIVNQATAIPHHRLNSAPVDGGGREREDELMFWLNNCLAYTMTTDALVPTPTNTRNFHQRVAPSKYVPSITSTCLAGGSSGAVNGRDSEIACDKMGADNEKVYQKPGHSDIIMLGTSKAEQSMMSSATRGDRDLPTERLTATYMVDNHDSICHGIPQGEVGAEDEKKRSKISSFSTKIRRAAVHNKSERNRRDRINQRMKALQKLVPNSSNTTNKAEMLDEVIEYLKQLEAQVQAIRNTMMYPMMLPMAAQQQLQMSMMSPAMRMRMDGLMDINALTHPNVTATPSVLHPAFSMHVASGVSPGGHLNAASTVPIVPNPLSTFQSQPMTVDAYSKMAALHHQQYLQPSASWP